ncbi:copper amine oxidase N-terminal domain-containing protein [Paenibacillus hubeiensis]|uniref:copper amine oxidase N-terminal domain-containing protein n=1 Tax=Paenibacillus hubeiensis TaxID=3077330 RepID=UPI0031B9EB9D
MDNVQDKESRRWEGPNGFKIGEIMRYLPLWFMVILMASIVVVPMKVNAASANGTNSIVSLVDRNTYLMNDGTVWSKDSTEGIWTQTTDVAGVSAAQGSLFGWTTDGRVYYWEGNRDEKPVITQYNGLVKVYGNGVALLKDGTLRDYKGEAIKGLESVIDVGTYLGSSYHSYGALTSNGDVYYIADQRNISRKMGNVPGGKQIATSSAYAAVLREDNSVVVVDMMVQEQPIEVTDHVKSVIWLNSGMFLAVKDDGSVWSYEREHRRPVTYEGKQLQGLSGVEKLEYSVDLEELYVQHTDGSWGIYKDGTLQPLNGPTLKKVTLAASAKEASVGDILALSVEELYSNGYKTKRQPNSGEITVEKPQVAVYKGEGQLQVKGAGSTRITFKKGELDSSVQLNAGIQQNLIGSSMVNGSIYLPVQSVFKALGATVQVKGTNFMIQWGDDELLLQKGSQDAKWNGKTLKLKGKLQTINGQTVFPAALLSQISGVKVQWETEFKRAKLIVGASVISVDSAETAKLVKQKELGGLARLLGKSYWINYYPELGQRFSKVTISDIRMETDPSGIKNYTIIFKNAKGKMLSVYGGNKSSDVTDWLNEEDLFLSYDPYQKYKWSQAMWNNIIAGKVAIGMNTTQARLAWGEPRSISQEMSKQGKIEVWMYIDSLENIRALTFVGGKLFTYY